MSSSAKKKLALTNIEDVLRDETSKINNELEGSHRPVLRETTGRLNRPLEMSSLLQKLPHEEAAELDLLQGGGGEEAPEEGATFGFQTPSKRRGRQSLLQLALSSSAQKRQQQHQQQLSSPSHQHLPTVPEEHDTESTTRSAEVTPERRAASKGSHRAPSTPSTPRPARTSLLTPKCIPPSNKRSPPHTPGSRRSLAPQLGGHSTPFRRALRTRIKEVVYDTDFEDESDEDIPVDSDEDEFLPDGGWQSASSADSSIDEQLDEEEEPRVPSHSRTKRTKVEKEHKEAGGPKRQRRCAPEQTATSETYFLQQEGAGRTSDRTLSQLSVPRLSRDALRQMVGTADPHHLPHRRALLRQHRALFDKWATLMEHGFSVCVHGVGSKKPLLAQYQELFLGDVDHIVVNGFFPSLTLKNIVSCILEEVLCLDTRPPALCDQLDLIHSLYSRPTAAPLVIVVHNLDGPMLRSGSVQRPLSRLCALPAVRLLASVDHINAPLVLDSKSAADYNFVWFECTTLAPYAEETSYENCLLVQQSSSLALASLIHVFKSLTPSAKGIFLLLVEHQLQSLDDPSYQGMNFSELYQQSRERMYVNSDLTLRTQLTEFRDHKLLRLRRGHDGAEVLHVPVAAACLRDFVEQQQQQQQLL